MQCILITRIQHEGFYDLVIGNPKHFLDDKSTNTDIDLPVHRTIIISMNILAQQYRNSGILSTDVPDVDTGIDWLGYLVQNSQECQAQSRFVVRSRLDILVNSEIIVNPNQVFIAVLYDWTVVHFEPEYSIDLTLK